MIIARIKSLLPELRPSERKVAELVLAQPNLTAGSSIKMIAASAGASEPTVIRFCRAVGCVGVQDLKRQIIRDLGRLTPEYQPAFAPGDPFQMLAATLCDQAFSAVFELRRTLASPLLGQAASRLAQSGRIWVWGFGNAASIASACADAFSREDLPARSSNDPYVQIEEASASTAASTALLISLDGLRTQQSDALLSPARLVRAAGGTIITLAPSTSALTALAHIALALPEADSQAALGSPAPRFAAQLLIDALRIGAGMARAQAGMRPALAAGA